MKSTGRPLLQEHAIEKWVIKVHVTRRCDRIHSRETAQMNADSNCRCSIPLRLRAASIRCYSGPRSFTKDHCNLLPAKMSATWVGTYPTKLSLTVRDFR